MKPSRPNRPKKAVVPAPSSTSHIQDDHTRRAIQQLQDGWKVRNGWSGDGEQRFITKAELLGEWSTQFVYARRGGGGGDDGGGGGLEGPISDVIETISQDVFNSRLWQYLGEPIEALKKPNVGLFDRVSRAENEIRQNFNKQITDYEAIIELITEANVRIDTAEANFLDQVTLLASADEALAERITALNAKVDDNEAAIIRETTALADDLQTLAEVVDTQYSEFDENLAIVQGKTETLTTDVSALAKRTDSLQSQLGDTDFVALEQSFETIADEVDGLSAQYTVKIDNNGYVSGFGLASSPAEDGTPYSEFYVRADRFAVGHPWSNRVVPFIVQGGRTYIDIAMIREASIDTLRLAGQTVVVPVAKLSNSTTGDSISFSVNNLASGEQVPVLIHVGVVSSSGDATFSVYHRAGGSTYDRRLAQDIAWAGHRAYIGAGSGTGNGTNTIRVDIRDAGSGPVRLSINAIVCKR